MALMILRILRKALVFYNILWVFRDTFIIFSGDLKGVSGSFRGIF